MFEPHIVGIGVLNGGLDRLHLNASTPFQTESNNN